MGSPITESDFDISNFSGDVCEAITKLLTVNSKLKTFFGWAFNDDGSQVTPEFAALFTNYFFPVGAALWVPVTAIPGNCVKADGRSLLRAHASVTNLNGYPELFAVYGTAFGFEDSTHFSVPDLRGVFLFGASDNHAVGEEGGEETHKLTAAELPAHTHTISLEKWKADGNTPIDEGLLGVVNDTSDATLTSSSIGGGASHENMPPYFTGIWVIKAK